MGLKKSITKNCIQDDINKRLEKYNLKKVVKGGKYDVKIYIKKIK